MYFNNYNVFSPHLSFTSFISIFCLVIQITVLTVQITVLIAQVVYLGIKSSEAKLFLELPCYKLQ